MFVKISRNMHSIYTEKVYGDKSIRFWLSLDFFLFKRLCVKAYLAATFLEPSFSVELNIKEATRNIYIAH